MAHLQEPPRIELADVLRRLLLVARALGFVYLIFFIPFMLRELIGGQLPGGGFHGLLTGQSGGPWIPLAIVLGTVAISVAFVLIHMRTGPDTVRPRRLLRCDGAFFREWGWGCAGGAFAVTLAVLPAFLAGALRLEGFSSEFLVRPGVTLAVTVALCLEAAREELGFRGPAFRDLANGTNFPIAALFLGGSFAILHAGNPAVGRAGLFGIFLAGVALAGLVRARGDVAMACGAHAGWNLFQGVVWAQPVSGFSLASPLLDVATQRPSWWMGGEFGVEGSAPGIAVLFGLVLLTWRLPSASAARKPEADVSMRPDGPSSGRMPEGRSPHTPPHSSRGCYSESTRPPDR
jgi:membrane protease YdiL (CAAX protease family)